MRRSICVCEPNTATAGEKRTWNFCFTPAAQLPKGSRLRFHLTSKGRDIDWELPQVDAKEEGSHIWVETPDGKRHYGKEVDVPESLVPLYEFTLTSEVKAGETAVIVLASSVAQQYVQRRRPFYLYVDPKGKGDFKDPETFSLDVKGSSLHHIRIISPAVVSKNRRFDVFIRFEDIYGNLTGNAPDDTLIELSYENLRENLVWKLFVPETGFLSIPNLYFNEAGNYRIQLINTLTKEKFTSSPIKCLSEGNLSLFWGELHGESPKFDATETMEQFLRHCRDDLAYQFIGSSPFEDLEETSNEAWKTISNQITEFDEESRFSAFLGFQWFEPNKEEGLRQMIYAKDAKPILRKKDSKNSALKKIYKGHATKDMISIPCFTMSDKYGCDFSDFDADYERVVEIYNAWGCSECLASEGNPFPITCDDDEGTNEQKEGSIQNALKKNCRFGFIAGGFDDRGVYQGLFETSQQQYTPGMTAIFAENHTRDALFVAMQNRYCYATTGERILLYYSIANAHMGQELNTKAKPGLGFNRHITGWIVASAKIAKVEFIRNGKVAHTMHPEKADFEFAYDDTTPLHEHAFAGGEGKPPFVYYYVRVTQENGHMAWGTPIWIDITGESIQLSTSKVNGSTKKSKK